MPDPAPPPSPDLAQAMKHYRAAEWSQAERICQAILQREPTNARALHLAGAAAAQLGRHAEAVERLRSAVRVDPAFADAWADLSTLLAMVSSPTREPGDVDVHLNAGVMLQ